MAKNFCSKCGRKLDSGQNIDECLSCSAEKLMETISEAESQLKNLKDLRAKLLTPPPQPTLNKVTPIKKQSSPRPNVPLDLVTAQIRISARSKEELAIAVDAVQASTGGLIQEFTVIQGMKSHLGEWMVVGEMKTPRTLRTRKKKSGTG